MIPSMELPGAENGASVQPLASATPPHCESSEPAASQDDWHAAQVKSSLSATLLTDVYPTGVKL